MENVNSIIYDTAVNIIEMSIWTRNQVTNVVTVFVKLNTYTIQYSHTANQVTTITYFRLDCPSFK